MAYSDSVAGKASASTLPVSDEEDEVYPVHALDDTPTLRGIVLTWTLCFNDVLDADRIHVALLRLLEMGDWRKLGGRLRLKNGRLEIHVPSAFTTERPAVCYTNQIFDIPIEEHPVAKKLPRATENASIHRGPREFQMFATRDNAPRTMEDYLAGDIPQLSLHITSFTNYTTVGISFPHTLMDVMGQQALLQSWSLVLAGRDAEVPPLIGAREDVLYAEAHASADTVEEFVLTPDRMSNWGMIKFTAQFIWDYLWYKTVDTRTICLPTQTLIDMHTQAQNELSSVDEKGEKPFLSEGDILTAWGIRAIASSLPKPRPITALHAINARFRLPSLINAAGVFVQNMALGGCIFLSHKTATGPLGPIALESRRHLVQQATKEQIVSGLLGLEAHCKGRVDAPDVLFGPSDALMVPFSNWTRADLFKAADFSSAILRKGEMDKSRNNPPGTVVFQHSSSMRETPSARNFFMVLGHDYGGNCWVTGTLLPATWAVLEEELKTL